MGYTLKTEDVNFLNAASLVIETHKEEGIKPDSDGGLSKLISTNRNLIYRIRNEQAGVPKTALETFCEEFHFDINTFYLPQAEFEYDHTQFDYQKHFGNQGVYVGSNDRGFVSGGDMHNPVSMGDNQGNFYQGGTHNHVVQSVLQDLDPETRHKLDSEFQRLYDRIHHLEAQLEIQTAHIKKMTEDFNAQIKDLIALNQSAQSAQLKSAEQEKHWMQRYFEAREAK